jgi:AcrR family transcriptional regulator
MPTNKKPARRRNAAATRAALLQSARAHFIAEGYEGLGLRQIAADARVDVALVGRYFGSKEKLFIEVLRQAFRPELLVAGSRESFGQRVMEALYRENPHQYVLEHFLLMIRALTVPSRIKSLRVIVNTEFIHPFAKWLGGKNALVRASLISTLLSGVALQSDGAGPLSSAESKKFREVLTIALQALVDGKDLDPVVMLMPDGAADKAAGARRTRH